MSKNYIVAAWFSIALAASVQAGQPDERRALSVNEEQRGLVLAEMRALLEGTRRILGALAENDMADVAASARAIGMAMAHQAEAHLKGVLPDEFMRLGMSVHKDFDLLAADADAGKDTGDLLRRLSGSMDKCVACHAEYQLRAQ